MPQVGEVDGHGRYGVVDEDGDGLLCHECGRRFTHLGLHAWKRHGMPADAYRQAHGLGGRGLVAAGTRTQIASNARSSMASKTKFLTRRDPVRARAIQTELGKGMSPAGTEAVREALRSRTRRAIVITCERCGAQFCPPPARRTATTVLFQILRIPIQPSSCSSVSAPDRSSNARLHLPR